MLPVLPKWKLFFDRAREQPGEDEVFAPVAEFTRDDMDQVDLVVCEGGYERRQ